MITSIASVIRGRDYYGRYEKMRKRNLRKIPSFNLISLLVKGKILEIGCGVGYLSSLFVDYVGIDVSKKALMMAKKNTGFEYIVADALNLPFRSRSFDCCVSYDSLEHLKDVGCALAEMRRIAAKVVLSFVDFCSYYRFFTYDETHVNICELKKIDLLLRKHFSNVRLFKSSGIFNAPSIVNKFLGKYFPNQIIFAASTDSISVSGFT